MHFDSVVAFGDSHVAGCEIIDGLITQPSANWRENRKDFAHSDQLTKPLAFPNLVAQRLNIPCHNYAMSGASNQRNLRILTSVIEQHPNSLVLYGYTSSVRTEFYMPNNDKFLMQDGDFAQFMPQLLSTYYDEQDNLYQMFYMHFYHYRNTLAEYMFCVDSICQTHAAAYVHIPLFPEVSTAAISTSIKHILQYENADNYLDWCKAKKFTPKLFLHYGQEAHDAMAKLILQQISA